MLQVKLKYLDGWSAARQRNAARYRELFAASGRVVADAAALREHGQIALPREAPARRHIYNQFVIRVQAPRRSARVPDRARHRLRGLLPAAVPPAGMLRVPRAPCRVRFRLSERASAEVLALPIYPELNDAQIASVTTAVLEFLRIP